MILRKYTLRTYLWICFNTGMTKEMHRWLIDRGITTDIMQLFNLSMAGSSLAIPIHDKCGYILFRKYRKSPFITSDAPKYTYEKGTRAQLFGWWQAQKHSRVVICEGELDALMLWSIGIPAVSSTGGAMTWNSEWTKWLSKKEVIICYDNDTAGGVGANKLLTKMPHARVALVPPMCNKISCKDITEFAVAGGSVVTLLEGARSYTLSSVEDERTERCALFLPVSFHDAFISSVKKPATASKKTIRGSGLEKAKTYPIDTLIPFVRGKALCLWHDDKTPSLTYYPKTNTAYCFGCGKCVDAIDIYRKLHNCSFLTAIKNLT